MITRFKLQLKPLNVRRGIAETHFSLNTQLQN